MTRNRSSHSAVARLEEQLSGLDAEIAHVGAFLPRLFAIESEYKRQLVTAELAYVQSLVGIYAPSASPGRLTT